MTKSKRNKKRNDTEYLPTEKADRVVSYCAYGLVLVLIVFAVVSASSPNWLAKISRENKEQEIKRSINVGISFAAEGETQKAIATFLFVVEELPDATEAKINLGAAYKRLGRTDKAMQYFESALADDPPRAVAHKIYDNLYDIYSALGKSEHANDVFEKSTEVNPFPIDRQMKIGVKFMNEKNYSSAAKAFKSALELRDKMPVYYESMLWQAKADYDEPRILEAIDEELESLGEVDYSRFSPILINLLLEKDRGLAENLNKLGFCRARLGEFDEAAKLFERALRIYPEYSDARINLNYVNEKIKQKTNDKE